jgi:hypothetical protein
MDNILVSRRKNRATAQSNARSDENAWWISAVSELRHNRRATA